MLIALSFVAVDGVYVLFDALTDNAPQDLVHLSEYWKNISVASDAIAANNLGFLWRHGMSNLAWTKDFLV